MWPPNRLISPRTRRKRWAMTGTDRRCPSQNSGACREMHTSRDIALVFLAARSAREVMQGIWSRGPMLIPTSPYAASMIGEE